MKRIGVVTTSRADYGIYLPVLHAIEADPELELSLYVTGMHLSSRLGMTVQTIEADGFRIVDRIETIGDADTPEAIAESLAAGVAGFGRSFARWRPDLLVVLGDRFDMYAAAVAALPFGIPLAHIHGGESTEGLVDEAIRHSLTKMSHLHFVSTGTYRDRVIQLGEDPEKVTVSGAPALDNLTRMDLLSREDLAARGVDVRADTLLVTFHPVTLEADRVEDHVRQLLDALDRCGNPTLFTLPNADTHGMKIADAVRGFVAGHDNAALVENLGTQAYFSVMAHAGAMVGNSSSGIIEAASLGLPVVNIGRRQQGRVHGENVVDVECEAAAIAVAIGEVCSASFREGIRSMTNPYGDGHAAQRIVERIKTVQLDGDLLLKRFHMVKGGC